MRVTILGRRWNLKFVPRLRRRGHAGITTSPNLPNPTMTIESGHRPIVELETLLHEMQHAGDWTKDEDFVREFSKDVAKILWRLGWRKTEI